MNRPNPESQPNKFQFEERMTQARFTIRRAYQKPPTCSVRQTRHKGQTVMGQTVMTKAAIMRTIERLKGYAISAATDGDLRQAGKYNRALRAFIASVHTAMAAAGIEGPTKEELKAIGVE